MGAPSYVYTISCVAKMLDEPEAWLEKLALTNLDPHDGCLGVVDDIGSGLDKMAVTAFTENGIEAVREVLVEARQKPARCA